MHIRKIRKTINNTAKSAAAAIIAGRADVIVDDKAAPIIRPITKARSTPITDSTIV